MFKNYRFKRICKRIKDIKIQGATNVAKAALRAYYLYPSSITKRVLLNLRPTEPMLSHVLELTDKKPRKEILGHFKQAQEKINQNLLKILNNKKIIFTHCHSTNVVKALIYAKKIGKHFEVYNTETRPLYQGRKTAKELGKAGIKVINFVDSAAAIAMEKVDLVLFGADALLKDAVINKVGSGMFAQVAYSKKIPVYIVADSWKYSAKGVKLEQRDFQEVWGTKKIHVKNPAFESINPGYIKGIVTELGVDSYKNFLNKAKKRKY